MTASSGGGSGGRDGLGDLNDAVRSGLRRAGLHWMRAGYEVLAGIGAFLDELATAGRVEETGDEEEGPTKIQLD